MTTAPDRLTLAITSYLEPEHVETIRAVDPARVEVLYAPELLPPPRYVSDHKGPDNWRRSPEDEARFWALVARAQALWNFPLRGVGPQGILARAPGLRWVQTTSSGVGPQVKEMGLIGTDVRVTNAAGIHAGPLTEFAMLALLMHAKQLDLIRDQQARQHWARYCTDELEGKTLAVIGLGNVGKRIAKVAGALGMRVLGVTARPSPERAAEAGLAALYPPTELHAVLRQADAVVLILPESPQTAHMFNRAAFAALKRGAVFINIARGSVVDEDALLDALRDGTIAFAALDVFATEPLPVGHPLWTEPKVLVAPHSVSTAYRENERLTALFCHNLRCLLDGRAQEMRNLMDFRTL